LRILEVIEIPLNAKPLSVVIEKSRFRISSLSLQSICGLGPEKTAQKVEDFLRKDSFLVTRRGKKGPRTMDIRPAIEGVFVTENGDLEMLLHCGDGGLGPVEAACFILGISEKDARSLPMVKTGFAFRGGDEQRCPAS
jgi:hypothetical protein